MSVIWDAVTLNWRRLNGFVSQKAHHTTSSWARCVLAIANMFEKIDLDRTV